MKKDGLTFTILAVICSGLGLVLVWVQSRSTESTLIGRASDAINRLNRPGPEKTLLMNNIPVAYAVSDLVGTACIVWFLPNLGPKPMGVNLKEEGRKLQAQISSGEEPEADDKSPLDFPQEFLDVVITNKALAGKPFREQAGMESARGVFLRKLMRIGEPMPFTSETRVDRGDVLSLADAKRDVERAAKELGYADRMAITADMIFVGLVVAVLPHFTAILFGRYVLKMNPLIHLALVPGPGR